MSQSDISQRPIPSPIRLFIVLLVTIASVEMLVMIILPLIVPDGSGLQDIADALLLTTLSAPFLWRLVARPLRSLAVAQSCRANTLLENMEDAVIGFDSQGTIDSLNPAAERIFGYSSGEAIGMPIGQFIPDLESRSKKSAEKPNPAPPFTQGRLSPEATGIRKNGCILPLEISVTSLGIDGEQSSIVIARDITKRKQAEAERERLLLAIEQAAEIIIITDATGAIQYVNPAFEQTTGYSREEVLGANPRILKSGQQDEVFYRTLWDTISNGKAFQGRLVNQRKDGSLFTEEATISPVVDGSGRIVNYVAVKRDITERLQLEAQYLQAQKMESIGRLAGGVAHDFNNMLSVIIGYTELAMHRAGPQNPLSADLQEILKAADRSAAITRQLLGFARKQTIKPQALDLNETVEKMLNMLRRLIGEDIDLLWKPCQARLTVNMDPSQLDQILANLCVNARDAIGGLGKITIETGQTNFDASYCAKHFGFSQGEYALLAVSDDGCGMDRETLEKIFEPFFTTKDASRGTGLGLATVYGIVKQNRGFINVYSEPGGGTTVKVYLKPYSGDSVEGETEDTTALPVSRGETILLVDDDPAVMTVAQKMLQSLGYEVLTASTPREAITLAATQKRELHLLISDVIMPEMNGRQLAEEIRQHFQELQVLFMSGYTANVIAHRGILDDGVNYMQKPFNVETLAKKVRTTLDGTP